MTRSMSLLLLLCGTILGQTADPPLAFEVASVKPAPPPTAPGGRMTGCFGGPGTKDPGVYNCYNASVSLMAFQAYSLKRNQISSAYYADTTEFNVVAKVPAGATADQVKVMLQHLLAERFKLSFHYEKKELPVYDLVVAKGGPKMKESAHVGTPPESKRILDQDGFSYTPMPNSMQVARANGLTRWVGNNVSVDMLGRWLEQTGRSVTNATALPGKYDFTLTFTSDSLTGPSAAAQPSEVEGGLSIFAALEKQLGLRLESKKNIIDIFVIDHAEKTPLEN
jgi:uncharacterized protein (TIGR03435 family)